MMPSLFSRRQHRPAGAVGWRAYVVGDVHGRLDLLEDLLSKIGDELEQQPQRKALLVFLGDLIDRGPSSAQVLERLRSYSRPGVRTIFLLGNHEEVLLRILKGEETLLGSWLNFGGMECIESYRVDPRTIEPLDPKGKLVAIRRAVPLEHVKFLESFVYTCRFGDDLFVHAGIRPGIQIEQQRQTDLRWIREPFLFDETDHGFVVVHGHTIRPEVEALPNRIGIDTGAYRTGVLTALAIEGSRTWVLDTRPAQDAAGRRRALERPLAL
jgi:serine/threonine protein phosphatase 1